MHKKAENEWVLMEIKDHYFYTSYKPNTRLDLTAAKTIVKDAIKLSGNKIYPSLTDIREMPTHAKDVREYFASVGSDNTTANAILVANSLSTVLANFFLTINKPIVPTRIFTDLSEAAKWLEMFPVQARPLLI